MLKNKRILVAGSEGLLGNAITQAILQDGGSVVAVDTNLKTKVPLNNEATKTIEYLKVNITSKKSILELFEYCDKNFGALDGAVNATYPRNKNYGRKVFDVSFEDFSENIGLHLGSYFLFMQQCAYYAKKRSVPFSLVNLSSIYGTMAPRFEIYVGTTRTMPVEYAAIKAGLLHLNKYFSKYMKNTQFRVNSVSPGGIADRQSDEFINKYNLYCIQKGMLNSFDITGTINFLLSDKSIFVKGQNIIVDDGFSL